ncbi:phage holin family protein [Pseudomonas lopnurensis]|uniref:phage holin family protein n=1 Tax=Pseudomonas lopnurensis TaxID=1477517 RepID=UPI001879660E|nr:phage holin family protein [Pseudomonas lopnurensis]MBE7373594.1 phage holin family protein [Pseudomonas lopnurensis]
MNEQRNLNTPYEPVHSEQDTSVGGLLRQLTREVPSLFTKELALAKAELNESLRATKAGAASVATGGAVLLSGFIILLMSAVYFLGTLMEPWLAALIVGGVVVIIGLIMVTAGKKKFEASSFKPDRTLHSLNKDKEVVRGHA